MVLKPARCALSGRGQGAGRRQGLAVGGGATGEGDVLRRVGTRCAATQPVVIGDAEVVTATERGVVRLRRIAGRVIGGQLVVLGQQLVGGRCVGRVAEHRVGRLVLLDDHEDVVVGRHALDVEGGLLGLGEGDGGAGVGRHRSRPR